MSICPSGPHTGHPGCCQEQTWGQTLSVHPAGPAGCSGLTPDKASTSCATSWSPGPARSCCAQLGALGVCKEKKLGQAAPQEPVQTLPMAQTTLCPLCQREPRLSSPWCWDNADPIGKTQLSSLNTWPQSPLGFAPQLWPRNWDSPQFTLQCTP